MTREKAIELAVRRWMRLNGIIPNGPIEPWPDAIKAIRANFRIVCRQYGVR